MSGFEEVLLVDCESTGVVEVSVAGGLVAACSMRGPGKSRNEDSLLIAEFRGGCVICVADGMGGHESGERASRIALETLAERLRGSRGDMASMRHTVLDAFEAANRSVIGLGVDAGTTIAATVVSGGQAFPVHVGDSACIHVGARGRIKSWTIAHSPVGYAVEAGLLDEEEAMHHGLRHLVSNHLGSEAMRIDFGPARPIAKRDTLLVASDGLLDNLAPREIIEGIRRGSLGRCCEELASAARQRMEQPGPGEPSKPDDLGFALFRPRRSG